LEKSKAQMAMALPKHLTADRLLRVAMTSIQKTPKLMECTPQSLLACVMTCAQLGLEPDQFLGQAYLVPFKDMKKGVTICTLIPGYRGYIALARRSGELQTLSAQVVYSNDEFSLQYGVEDKLIHRPALNGRGEMIGAYCVFKYKDGGYSFDWMNKDDIEKIRKRSKAANDGPWQTDFDEMAKKTVIKRHAKLAPLSVEFQRAVALEERAVSGEAQDDLLGLNDPDVIDSDVAEVTADPAAMIAAFDASVPKGSDPALVNAFLVKVAEGNKKTIDEIKIAAASDPKELASLWKLFPAWCKQQAAFNSKKATAKTPVDALTGQELAPGPCPNREDKAIMTVKYCEECKSRAGCPAFESIDNPK
jgi:recombination protein RecT